MAPAGDFIDCQSIKLCLPVFRWRDLVSVSGRRSQPLKFWIICDSQPRRDAFGGFGDMPIIVHSELRPRRMNAKVNRQIQLSFEIQSSRKLRRDVIRCPAPLARARMVSELHLNYAFLL